MVPPPWPQKWPVSTLETTDHLPTPTSCLFGASQPAGLGAVQDCSHWSGDPAGQLPMSGTSVGTLASTAESETHVVDGGRQPCLGANLTWDFFGLSGPRQLLRSPPAPVLRSRSRPCATGKRQFLPLGGGSGPNPGVSPKPFLMTLAAPNLSADLCAPHSSPRVLSPRWGQLPAHHLPVLRDHFTSPMEERRAHSRPQCRGPSHFRHYLTSSSQPSL